MSRNIKIQAGFIIFTVAAIILSLNMGAADINLFKLNTSDIDILLKLRVPRILTGLIVGAGLSLAGAVLQSVLKNPLAEPYIIGSSSGAALGTVIASLAGIAVFKTPAAFAGAILAVFLVYNISRLSNRSSSQTLILAGVAVTSFFSALTLLFMVLNKESAYGILFFLMGNLSGPDWNTILWLSAAVLPAAALILFFARDLDILSLGAEEAFYLGTDSRSMGKFMIGLSTVAVAACVAATGIIGFVGLIVPHVVRLTVGASHRRLLPAALIAGGGFLVICDGIARSFMAPIELPVGIITAFTGAPFFIYLLLKKL